MLPIASGSGIAIIVVVVVSAGLFLSWLLRSETDGEASAERSDENANGDS
jgi:hypothetical protein